MQSVAVTLTCLLFTVGQSSGDVIYTNQRGHRIPIVPLSEQDRRNIEKLILYVSKDQGRSWEQGQVVGPASTEFTYTAVQDGEYWFSVAAMQQNGVQDPPSPSGATSQKMIVDTRGPIIDLVNARRDGGTIAVGWSIQEPHPDPQSLTLSYQIAGSGRWQNVPITPAPRGEQKFTTPTEGNVIVRLQMKDRAGNSSFAQRELAGTNVTKAAFSNPNRQALPERPSPTPADPWKTKPALAPAPTDNAQFEMPPRKIEDQTNRAVSNNQPRAFTDTQPNAYRQPEKQQLVATSNRSDFPPRAAVDPRPVTEPSPSRPLPKVRYVNSTKMFFDYELETVGPSGIGSIDVWWTRDDGQVWQKLADDPEAKPTMRPGRYKRMLELPGDGIYGLTCVAVSRAELLRRQAGHTEQDGPKSGDAPEIRVEVDTTAPTAKLFLPIPDRNRANTLLLTWTASDKNLAASPISIEWSEQAEGPWQPIAGGLPNSGRFSWQLPARMPVQVYLRVRARDLAGNEGIAATPEPQIVDLVKPKARFVDVSVTPSR